MQRNLANVSVTNSRLYGAQGSLSAICGHILSMGGHFPNDLPLIVYTPTNPTKRTPVLGCGSLVTAQGLVTIFIFFPSTLKTTREESKMSNFHTTLFQNSFVLVS